MKGRGTWEFGRGDGGGKEGFRGGTRDWYMRVEHENEIDWRWEERMNHGSEGEDVGYWNIGLISLRNLSVVRYIGSKVEYVRDRVRGAVNEDPDDEAVQDRGR